ncbi:MAG: hypothetical protein VX777_06180 [Chlamydiota bacterium]|nr:hypothetical protein [Chlamydiota bacterium]
MLTRLIAIRHAKPFSEGFADEILRPISKQGRSIQISITEKLKSLGFVPDQIFSSPILRAEQTAHVISEIFDDTPVTVNEALGYNFNQSDLLSLIPSPSENKTIFFVGHAPTLADFVNKLVGSEALPEGLKQSGAAVVDFRLDVEYGAATFSGYYHP